MTRRFVQYPTLNEKVYEIIKEMIISGDLCPGFRLQEDTLVSTLGTSKTPIKFALAKLEKEGLVRTVPRRGTYVIDLTVTMTIEIFLLREVLEGLAARLAARNLHEKDIQRIQAILAKMKTEFAKPSPNNYLKLDEEFHDIIVKASNHQRLQEILNNLFDIIKIFKLRASLLQGRRENAQQEHMRVFEALKKHDTEESERTMRFHIQQVLKNMIEGYDFNQNRNGEQENYNETVRSVLEMMTSDDFQ